LPQSLLRGAGIFLLPFALALVVLAPRAGSYRPIVRVVVIGNMLWVLASLAILSVVQATVFGEVFLIAQAAAVGVFAYLEHVARREQERDVSLLGSVR
jgi:hypothetical protein